MGAAMHGIENICCLTGDDVTAGDEPEARRVFDLDGPQLLALARASSAAATSRAARSSRRRTSSSARSRTPARRRSSTASAAPRRRRSPARASCSCRSATGPSCSSGSCAPPHDTGLSRARRADPLDLHPAHGRRHAVRRHEGARGSTSRRGRRAGRAGARTPRPSASRSPTSSPTHALEQPGVAGLHFISFRKDAGIAKLCTRLGIPAEGPERETNGYSSPVAV